MYIQDINLCVCLFVCLHPSCMTSRLLCTPMEFTHTFFFLISAKSSQLLHPSLYSPNTHTNTYTHIRTRQLRHRLRNSLLPWQWNRARSLASPVLFYCFISLSLSVEAKQLPLFDRGLVFSRRHQVLDICLFVYQRHIVIVM